MAIHGVQKGVDDGEEGHPDRKQRMLEDSSVLARIFDREGHVAVPLQSGPPELVDHVGEERMLQHVASAVIPIEMKVDRRLGARKEVVDGTGVGQKVARRKGTSVAAGNALANISSIER